MHKEIATLHYLTQDLPHYTHEQQVRVACEAGAKWIQLRVKNKKFDEWLTIAGNVRKITDSFGATLIINDSVEIAKQVNADGVHLGQEDMNCKNARIILGPEKIIGLSTHSLKELLEVKNAAVDYFGLGPFQFTSTIEKLNPVLGLTGIHEIILDARRNGITKPIIAIGGIQLNDVIALLNAGANGIAVSSGINLSSNPSNAIPEFLNQLETINPKPETFSR